MPTYEYECTVCGHTFEKFQSIKAEPVKNCPICGKKVRRLIGAGAGLIFKGSGFYITDYRSKDYQDRKKEDKKKESDTKPEKPKGQSNKKDQAEKKDSSKKESQSFESTS